MNEPTKPRFTVDLEEIDRQLRRAAPPSLPGREPDMGAFPPVSPSVEPPASQPVFEYGAFEPQHAPEFPQPRQVFPGSGQGNDPLQELARIVGQEDPFQSLLGRPGSSPRRPQPQISTAPSPEYQAGYADAPVAPREAPGLPPLGTSPEVGTLSEYLRQDGFQSGHAETPAQGRQFALSTEDLDAIAQMAQGGNQASQGMADRQADAGAYMSQMPVGGFAPKADGYGEYAPSYADPKLGYHPEYDYADQDDQIPHDTARRKLLLLGGVAVLSAILVVAGGYLFLRGNGVLGPGEPPLITASGEPTKVAPDTPGGKEFPDQNKQIYQGNTREGSTQVVNREEQPVDIREATGARNAPASASNGFGEARKVRTVAVRPDGTLIGDSSAPAGARNPTSAFPVTASGNPAAGAISATQNNPASAPVVTATPSAQPAQASRPAQSAETPPVPPRAQQTQPVSGTQQTASAAQATPPSGRPAQQAAAASSSGGAYAVQFGVSGSEAEGKTRFSRLKSQFPDVLGSVTPSIRSAEINGRTVYRIRTGGMSKEAGDALCANLKAAGGDCYVARN